MTDHHMLQLRPKGKLVCMDWDHVAGRHTERAIETDELAWHLHDSMCLASGTTLRDLLMLIGRDTNLFGVVTACDCIGELVAELDVEPEPAKEIVALEISWGATVALSDTPIFDDFVEFCGHGDEGKAAIEFTPVNRLAELPILLNEAFNVWNDNDTMLFSATKHFSLLDIVRGVLDELTFLGSPAERDEALADLRSRIKTLDDGEFYTIDEVREEMDKRAEEDKRRFPCRFCGEDSRCMCFGKPDDICHDCFRKMREN